MTDPQTPKPVYDPIDYVMWSIAFPLVCLGWVVVLPFYWIGRLWAFLVPSMFPKKPFRDC